MITITNQKIIDLAPNWAPFRGFTVLFNSPNSHILIDGKLQQVYNNLSCQTNVPIFYQGLHLAIDELDSYNLLKKYLFCSLPSYSYHVTACSGADEGNLHLIPHTYHDKLSTFLNELPTSLINSSGDIVELTRSSTLFNKRDWNLKFEFDHLLKWNNHVLLACLSPTKECLQNYKSFLNARNELLEAFQSKLGIPWPENYYIPHVTLGYFANEEFAQLSTSVIKEWEALIREKLIGAYLEFQSVDLYGFMDMVTFFKHTITTVV